MYRNVRWLLPLVLMTAMAGSAEAQYGWNGWGGSYGGGLGRGLGNFYAGRGVGNEENAVAGAINTNTTMRWNNALYQSSLAGARRYNAQNRAQRMDVDKDRAQVKDRIENRPEQLDISDGNTLNHLMVEILSPANANQSLATIKTPLKSEVIRDIPFEDASEDITFCMHELTMDEQWPLALRVPAFEAERSDLKKAMATALKADEKGDLDPATIAAVTGAVNSLRARFKSEIKPDNPDYYPALARIRTLTGLSKMLHSPKMDQVLAELEDYQGTTLGDLLAFMQSFNLRFAPANSFRQKQIYRKLYPMLNEQVHGSDGPSPGMTADASNKPGNPPGTDKTATDLKSAATDLFKDVKAW